MSYSRWSNSVWYTYDSSSLDNNIRDDQCFTICTVASFTYKELKEDMEKCLNVACHKQCLTDNGYDESLKPTPEEREELNGYMLRFIKYVENNKDLI